MGALRQTFKALASHRYWLYFIPPVVLAFFFALATSLAQWLIGLLEAWRHIGWVDWLMQGLGDVLIVVVVFSLKFTLLTLLSPLNSYLSEKIDQHYNGFNFKYTLGQFIGVILRSLTVALAALFLHITLMMLLLLPAWFFVGDVTLFILSTVLNSFFIGFLFFDYCLERYRVKFTSTFRWFLNHLPLCFTVGLVFNLLTQLPLEFELHLLYFTAMAVLPPVLTIWASFLYIGRKS